jgi:hypothetical protein
MRKRGMEIGIHNLLQRDHDTGQQTLEYELRAGKELEIDLRMEQGGAEIGGGASGGGGGGAVVSGVVEIEDGDLETQELGELVG